MTISITIMFLNSPQSTVVAGWEVSLEAVQLQVGVPLFAYLKPSFSNVLFLKDLLKRGLIFFFPLVSIRKGEAASIAAPGVGFLHGPSGCRYVLALRHCLLL